MQLQKARLSGVVLLGGIFAAGCQSTGVMQKLHTEMYPPVGMETSAEIGETILERTRGNGSPGFMLEDLEFEQSGYMFFLPGELYQITYESPEGESKAYAYGNIRSRTSSVSVSVSNYQVASGPKQEGCTLEVTTLDLVDSEGKLISNWLQSDEGDTADQGASLSIGNRTILSGSILGGAKRLFSVDVPQDKCAKRYKFANYGQTFSQELIYLGRSGDELSFKYREFSGSLARPAFSADLTYDLSESRTIGYRGARIEVIEAGNQLIRYRVQNHMKGI